MAKVLYIAFLVLCFISRTISVPGESLIWSRITLADIIGIFALIVTIPKFIQAFKRLKSIPQVYFVAMILVLGLVLTSFFSLYPLTTLVEVVIVFYLLLLSLGIYLTFKDSPVTVLFNYLMLSVILFTGIGFYDLVAEQIGLHRIFPVAKYPGVLISGFKNTGQAGSFYMIVFLLLIPLRFSKLNAMLSKREQWMLNVSLFCCIITFTTLGKYSVIYGLLFGLLLFIIYARKKNVVVFTVFTTIFIFCFLGVLKVTLPSAYHRVTFKFENRVVNTELNSKGNGFIEDNFTAAFTAFNENPFTGCGLGTFHCKYHTHEVHSTYLKMLGETGLIGSVLYIVFMLFFLRLFPISWKQAKNPYTHYLQFLLPLVIGALVTWIYTYHLRKREFWILVAVVLIIAYKQKECDLKQLEL